VPFENITTNKQPLY